MSYTKNCRQCDVLLAGQQLLEHAVMDGCEKAFTRLLNCGIIDVTEYGEKINGLQQTFDSRTSSAKK